MMSEQADGGGGSHSGAISAQAVEEIVAAQSAAAAQKDAAALSDYLSSVGLPASDQAGTEVQDWVTGKRSITPELRAQAQARWASLSKDPGFVKNLLAGGAAEMKLMAIASALAIANVEEAKL